MSDSGPTLGQKKAERRAPGTRLVEAERISAIGKSGNFPSSSVPNDEEELMRNRAVIDPCFESHYVQHVDRPNRLERLYSIAIALNVPVAIGFGVLAYVFATNSYLPWSGGSSLRYYIQRASFRITDLLRLTPFSKSHYHFGSEWPPFYWFIRMASVPLSALLVAILLWLLFRRVRVPDAQQRLVHALAGLSALLALPTAVVFARYYSSVDPVHPGNALWEDSLFRVWLGELAALFLLYALTRNKVLTRWLTVLLVSLHCLAWLFICCGIWSDWRYYLLPFLAEFWFSCLAWAFIRRVATNRGATRRENWLTVTLSAAVLIVLAEIWAPYLTRHPTDLKSVAAVTIERTSCFGSCPSYSITLHTNGSVEYVGKQFVRVKGRVEWRIPAAQVASLIGTVQEADLTSIDDRAFDWCYDTPFVRMTISGSGKEETVWSDEDCAGPRDGLQRRFLELTNKVDELVDTQQLFRCQPRQFCPY